MDRKKLIARLVNRKLAAGTTARGCVPCFGRASRSLKQDAATRK